VSAPWPLVRGRVYGAKLEHFPTEKYYLVVSNNSRNRKLDTALAVRLTTTRKPPMDSIVPLSRSEAFTGSVLCDDIVELWQDEITRDLGAMSPGAMQQVNAGLAAALGF
jgi:mRNA interferase MazF